MSKGLGRIIRAALVAFAAGVLVAFANPAEPIGRDLTMAMHAVAQLTAGTARAADQTFLPRLQVIRRAALKYNWRE